VDDMNNHSITFIVPRSQVLHQVSLEVVIVDCVHDLSLPSLEYVRHSEVTRTLVTRAAGDSKVQVDGQVGRYKQMVSLAGSRRTRSEMLDKRVYTKRDIGVCGAAAYRG
jgi:hypothetical protein